MEYELRSAIELGDLRLFFQPQMELADGRIVGVEALVRWQHPSRGLLPASGFIQIAEEAGLVVPLGRWVLGEACRHLSRVAAHLDVPEPAFTVAVNVSAKEIARPDYVELLSDVVAESRINPASIQLELTESTFMEATEHTVSQLDALRDMGLTVAIDDFGTGYSSLSYLRRLPVNTVKIDQSFIGGVGRDPNNSAITEAVINLAHCLGLTCVAEGVEMQLQLDRLRELGCDLAQGYYVGRPQPADGPPPPAGS